MRYWIKFIRIMEESKYGQEIYRTGTGSPGHSE